MIKAENITKIYRVQGKKHTVFENVNLDLPPGGRLALIGPNGAGKSTLLRVLCGVEKPNSGRVVRTSTLSWPIGVAQGFVGNLTGKENIQFVCRLFDCTRAQIKAKIAFVEDFAEIGDYFAMPLASYSSGMKSRLAFAVSMAFDFDYYVVDETLSVGDERFKAKCAAIFKEKAKDKGLILVSHSMPVILEFCDQGFFLTRGQLHFETDIDILIEKYQEHCRIKQPA